VAVKRNSAAASGLDAATLEACRRGEPEALGHVLRGRTSMLKRLVTHLVGPGPDVDDLVQTTLINAVRAFPRFRGEASVDTWLQRIAINAVRSHGRRERLRPRVSLELVPETAEPVDPAATPERATDDRRRLDRLYVHLAALGAAQRIAFVLHVVEGMAIEEIAALTGAGRLTTKSRIYWAGRALRARARKDPALRDLLEREGDS